MSWIAAYMVRYRLVAGAAMLVVTGLATWAYFPDPPPVKVTQDDASDASTERTPLQPERVTTSDQVSSRFDLAQSESFLVIECEDFFRPDSVRALRATVDAVEALPMVDTVFWLDRIPLINVFGFADPLLPDADASPETFAEARRRILEHPLIRGQLISPDGTTMMMPIVYDWLYVGSDEDLIEPVVTTARQAFEEELATSDAEDPPAFRIRLTGYVPLYVAQKSAFDRNQTTFRIIAYSLVLILAIIMFRGLPAVLLVAGAPALGMYWTFSLLELFDIRVNDLANVVMPILVTMIGLTDGIHLMVHIRRKRAEGDTPLEAAEHAINTIGTACWLTSLTTAIGFVSLMLAHSSFVRDFGRDCAIGVLITFVAVVTFIPLLSTTRLARNVHRGHERDFIRGGLRRTTWIVDALITHR
ncbi:MAG: MMPL family transporter, partial [Maioricimonas sp. JB049]